MAKAQQTPSSLYKERTSCYDMVWGSFILEEKVSGAKNREYNSRIRELESAVEDIRKLLDVAVDSYNSLANAHNSLQGFLIASGVIPESALKNSEEPGMKAAVDFFKYRTEHRNK
jgi:hypothetical protein